MATLTLYPNAVKANTFDLYGTADAVAAVRYQDGTKFIYTTGPAPKYATFYFENSSGQTGTINSVTLWMYARWWYTQYFTINGVQQSVESPTSDFAWYSRTFTSGYTWADIDSIWAGMNATLAINYDIRIDQIYLVVDYNPTATPVVTTTAVTAQRGGKTASGGGNVTSDGGSSVTARGVCWNTTGTPTTAASKTTDGTGTGVFTSTLTGLVPRTLYYTRAYATNSIGTAYGAQVEFTTLAGASQIIIF